MMFSKVFPICAFKDQNLAGKSDEKKLDSTGFVGFAFSNNRFTQPLKLVSNNQHNSPNLPSCFLMSGIPLCTEDNRHWWWATIQPIVEVSSNTVKLFVFYLKVSIHLICMMYMLGLESEIYSEIGFFICLVCFGKFGY